MQVKSILLTFIKLQFVINIFTLSIFEWPLNTGFTVLFHWIDQENNYNTNSIEMFKHLTQEKYLHYSLLVGT